MENKASFSAVAPPVFNGENYQMWAVRKETYLEALDLWEAVEEDYEIPILPNNPTITQIKAQKERRRKQRSPRQRHVFSLQLPRRSSPLSCH